MNKSTNRIFEKSDPSILDIFCRFWNRTADSKMMLGQKTEAPLTVWKVLLELQRCSHCIMSKKMGMVAFLSSGSGTNVASRIGPTIAGINFILCWPGSDISGHQKNLNMHSVSANKDKQYNSDFTLYKSHLNKRESIRAFCKNSSLHSSTFVIVVTVSNR